MLFYEPRIGNIYSYPGNIGNCCLHFSQNPGNIGNLSFSIFYYAGNMGNWSLHIPGVLEIRAAGGRRQAAPSAVLRCLALFLRPCSWNFVTCPISENKTFLWFGAIFAPFGVLAATAATRQQLSHLARPLDHHAQGPNIPFGVNPSLRWCGMQFRYGPTVQTTSVISGIQFRYGQYGPYNFWNTVYIWTIRSI